MNRLYINKDWSTLKKLIAIKAACGGAPLVEYTVTGNPATFSTNVIAPMELLIPFTPVQDLHGQDAPYPAGGGSNIFDEEMEKGSIDDSTGQNASGSVLRSKNYIPVVPGNQYYVTRWDNTGIYNIYLYDSSKQFIGNATALGVITTQKILTIPANAYFIRFRTYVAYGTTYQNDISINYPSSATSYAPYSNICPISGWTGANITGTGKNLLDVSSNVEDYALNASGIPTSLNGWNYTQLIPVNANQSYTFSFVNTDSVTNTWSRRVHAYDANGNWIGQIATISATPNVNERYSLQFSITSGTKYVRVSYPALYSTGIQIESGSSVSTYEQYTGEVYPITFPSTVYGGNVKVNKDGSRKLIADEVKEIVNDLTGWTGDTNGKRIYKIHSDAKAVEATETYNGVCEIAKPSTLNGLYNSDSVSAIAISSGKAISIKIPNYTTGKSSSSEIISAVSTLLPFELTYKLATPVEIDLTDSDAIVSLLGVNNVWADTNGGNTVKYMKKG